MTQEHKLSATLQERAIFLVECLLSMLLDSMFFFVWLGLTYLEGILHEHMPAPTGLLARFSAATLQILFAAALLIPFLIFLIADVRKLWRRMMP